MNCTTEAQKTEPIHLGYHGIYLVRPDDRVVYRPKDTSKYLPVKVLREVDVISNELKIIVQSSPDIRSCDSRIDKEDIIIATPDEIYWNRKNPLPADRLEAFLEITKPRRGSGVTLMM